MAKEIGQIPVGEQQNQSVANLHTPESLFSLAAHTVNKHVNNFSIPDFDKVPTSIRESLFEKLSLPTIQKLLDKRTKNTTKQLGL